MADDANNGGSGEATAPAGSAISRITAFMSGNKIAAGLWICRLITIVSSILFFLPIFGGNPSSLYQRVLLANAATSALRLHQRLPQFQLSREFMAMMFIEDSAHYLFYSLIFVMSHPISMALVPVFLFAVLHGSSYTKSLLNEIGPNSVMVIRNLLTKLDMHQRSILRFIACNEIFMMPMIVFLIFTGRASLLLPFIYYRFLSLRYASRRNPYCRQLFYELRITTEHLVMKPQCPQMVRNMSFKAIAFISRLAPEVPPQ